MKPGGFCTSTLTDILMPQLVASLDDEEFCLILYRLLLV